MIERLIAILFPLFGITAVGYLVARRWRPDMRDVNRLTMDVFTPCLIFGALAGGTYEIAQYGRLAVGMALVLVLCGAAGFGIARLAKEDARTFVPPMMFSNSGNLGIPLAVLAFGQQALPAALIMFMVSVVVHLSWGVRMLDPGARVQDIWRVPSLWAALAGIAVSLLGVALWPPLVVAIRMLGDIAIPIMLFALGVRLCDINFSAWRLGVIGGIARPLVGFAISWPVGWLLNLPDDQMALFLVYGALPPAVLAYIISERYGQEPERVASIVLIGNLFGVVVLPVVLAAVL